MAVDHLAMGASLSISWPRMLVIEFVNRQGYLPDFNPWERNGMKVIATRVSVAIGASFSVSLAKYVCYCDCSLFIVKPDFNLLSGKGIE